MNLNSVFLYKLSQPHLDAALCAGLLGFSLHVYKCNYTLVATYLPAKLTVLVCLAPGNSFHLYEMIAVEDRALLTHLSSL